MTRRSVFRCLLGLAAVPFVPRAEAAKSYHGEYKWIVNSSSSTGSYQIGVFRAYLSPGTVYKTALQTDAHFPHEH